MRGYNIRGDAGRCCTKAPYYASNERAGEGGLEVWDQVYTWVRPRWRDGIQMLCATQRRLAKMRDRSMLSNALVKSTYIVTKCKEDTWVC